MADQRIRTSLTDLLGIDKPIMLAGYVSAMHHYHIHPPTPPPYTWRLHTPSRFHTALQFRMRPRITPPLGRKAAGGLRCAPTRCGLCHLHQQSGHSRPRFAGSRGERSRRID